MQVKMQLEAAVAEAVAVESGWHLAKRLAFRFTFAYFALYVFPFPLGALPYTDFLSSKYEALWHAVVPWVGRHLLHLPADITIFTNGSGDTTYDYVRALTFLILSALATAVWSVLDRKRRDYQQLDQWLRVAVRFYVGATLISYGAFKVVKSQFPDPSLDRLIQTFGDASPMGLLWTFMGASTSYNVFAGLAEMVGGLLLIPRRTALLGALMCVAVMSNVFILNMSYDVPVKLFSFHLLLMSGFLALPELRRLANVFLFNRRAEAVTLAPRFQRTWLNRTAQILGIVFILYSTGFSMYQSYSQYKLFTDPAQQSPLRGVWAVDEFAVNGQVRPPLLTDEMRWQRLVFSYPGAISVQMMNGSRQRYALNLDMDQKTMSFSKRDNSDWKADFTFNDADAGNLVMEGQLEGQPIRVRLRRDDALEFRLTSRGFHWVNEYPYNR